jgi:hypothetical protein
MSGAADLIAHSFLRLMNPLGALGVMASFYLLPMLLAQILSGATTAVFNRAHCVELGGSTPCERLPAGNDACLGLLLRILDAGQSPSECACNGTGRI